MRLRSMLFVPADSERKLAKAAGSDADALILDLEDAVVGSRKPEARRLAAAFIAAEAARIGPRLFVRVNPLESGLAMADLAAVVGPGLAGIVLPKPRGAGDVARLGHGLDALEARAGLAAGSVRIVPIATESGEAVLSMPSYAGGMPRLAAITWGAEDLAAAVGALSRNDEDGRESPLHLLAGTLCLAAAAAANVPAIDTLHADFRDPAGLAAACRTSRRRGYRGRLAIHPDQLAAIHAAYTPSEDERERARAIVDLFAANPDAGALSLDGTLLDRPHLLQAHRTLELDD